MAKIHFDIKYLDKIESGEYKVETRDGKTVVGLKRQILHGTPLLYGIIEELECCEMWKEDGTANPKMKKDNNDLFVVIPEPELTKFEEAVYKVANYISPSSSPKDFKEQVRVFAAELLALARKELIKEGTSKNEMGTMLYDAGFEDGKAEALKDLPRWRKCAPSDIDDGTPPAWIVRFEAEREGNESKIVHNGYYIDFGSLERLPGFNE